MCESIRTKWDVINYVDTLRFDPLAEPRNYWSNTSSNEAVKRFIRESDKVTVKREIEKLVAGEVIEKEIHQDLTYKEMYDSIENLWSVLFTTGYLTQRGRATGDTFQLVIPNMEIRKIYTTQIMEYFKENIPNILELKYAQDGNLDAACEDALEQIESNNYTEVLEEDGVEKIIKYGIAFYKKKCKVLKGII